jgi:diguanylate cyclase (GGDEF)-like protein
MIEVDRFKAFNDAHGHEAGDAVLAAVGEVLRRYSRTSDVACRFGGEEFLMILPDCSLAYARLRADELRRRVSALYLCSRGIELPGSTISCGVAVSPMHGHRPEDLIFTAGTALYTAKRSGRDRVALAPLADTHTMTDR